MIKETTVRKSPRRGFTLLELLVVIGIILLLVSITVFGLRHVNATAARHETFAEMNICEGMIKEYGTVNGFTNIEGSSNSGATISPPAMQSVKFTLPIYLDTPSTQTGSCNCGPVSNGAPNSLIIGDDALSE